MRHQVDYYTCSACFKYKSVQRNNIVYVNMSVKILTWNAYLSFELAGPGITSAPDPHYSTYLHADILFK